MVGGECKDLALEATKRWKIFGYRGGLQEKDVVKMISMVRRFAVDLEGPSVLSVA